MSYKMRDAAMKLDADLSSMAKFTLIVIADFHNGKTGACYPRQEVIAKVMNTSRETVARNLKKLVEAKLITITNRKGANHSKSIIFHFPCCDAESQQNNNPAVTLSDPAVTLSDSVVTQDHTCCDAESHVTGKNRNITGNNNTPSKGFDDWFVLFPEDRKGNRATALKEWNRIKPDADVLIADTQKRLANDKGWLAGFSHYPASYLEVSYQD